MVEGPAQRYKSDIESKGFSFDPVQQQAIEALQELHQRLVDQFSAQPSPPFWRSWFGGKARTEIIRGLYMWGGVGRGKTYLLDVFFETLPFEQKLRVHFHRFMRRVHADLTRLKGEKNPLDKVAAELAKEAKVICFDEFFVSDITDAMILGNLLEALFKRGVVLVTTSNIEPSGLYKDGLQRERFLPAIALLEQFTHVLEVDGGQDYRLRTLTRTRLYHCPCGERADQALHQFFADLAVDPGSIRQQQPIEVEGRQILAQREADDLVWFEFSDLCEGPRSQHDYIVLSKEYHTVIVANVPSLGRHNDDAARRFVYLVDEFYDRRVKLILSAAEELTELYSEGRLSFEFERTQSRLLEMQSKEYLALPHRP